MPVYEYINAAGRTLELIRPVAQRDTNVPVGFRRVQVPRRLHVCFGEGPPSQEVVVRRGLYELEQQMTGREMERDFHFTKNELKQIWADGPPGEN